MHCNISRPRHYSSGQNSPQHTKAKTLNTKRTTTLRDQNTWAETLTAQHSRDAGSVNSNEPTKLDTDLENNGIFAVMTVLIT
ncbi:hypothetical protein E2C01_057969 [Portunus trituberculatus]|uniref:Uncharacterized protein n=1 Tax=Portunus trituberculatus TaxID=210409 RepID=A0A5B7GYE3_PORTR|nr:hypothetical protein [Portunus trituberculatus]